MLKAWAKTSKGKPSTATAISSLQRLPTVLRIFDNSPEDTSDFAASATFVAVVVVATSPDPSSRILATFFHSQIDGCCGKTIVVVKLGLFTRMGGVG